MDLLSGVLGGPRPGGVFLLRSLMEPPWSVRIEDRAPISLVAVTRGHAWVVHEGDEPQLLGPGGVAAIRGPEPYVFADDPSTPIQVVVGPGQSCRTVDGTPVAETMGLGVRTWGNDPDGSTAMLIGTYEHTGAIGERLLSVLPRTIILPAGTLDGPLLGMLGEEIVKDEPGQEAVLDRLFDLVLVSALRSWLASDDSAATSWYRAHEDPVVGRALRLMEHNVAHHWTIAGLANEVGVSRALLARRFTELVGSPPMTYLTDVRLALAADRLLEPDSTVGAVARDIGYGSAFALSTAFKRVRGVSPREHRLAAAGASA
jgi:AraC-like DNA-binding protein